MLCQLWFSFTAYFSKETPGEVMCLTGILHGKFWEFLEQDF